jgi:hypothetical protein
VLVTVAVAVLVTVAVVLSSFEVTRSSLSLLHPCRKREAVHAKLITAKARKNCMATKVTKVSK